MKSVLDIAGYFLHLGCMVIIVPIVLSLYGLLAFWKTLVWMNWLWLQLPMGFRYLVAACNRWLKHRWLPVRKWQPGWHLHKVS